MKIITFHSYKGGCGRSFSLANTAVALSKKYNVKVGILDLDFEAAAQYCLFDVDLQQAGKSNFLRLLQPGCMDVIGLEKYVVPITIKGESRASVFLSPTVTNATLLKRVQWDAGIEVFLRDEFIRSFKDMYKLDYIFIDSRSGLSDTSEFALKISDTAVLVCRMDRQNKDGIQRVIKVFSSIQKPFHLVVSGCPNPKQYALLIEHFGEIVGHKVDYVMPHVASMYFNEEIVTATNPKSPLAKGYFKLADDIARESE